MLGRLRGRIGDAGVGFPGALMRTPAIFHSRAFFPPPFPSWEANAPLVKRAAGARGHARCRKRGGVAAPALPSVLPHYPAPFEDGCLSFPSCGARGVAGGCSRGAGKGGTGAVPPCVDTGSGGQSHPRERRQLPAAPSRAAGGAASWPALVLPSRCQPGPWQPPPVAASHRWRGDSRGQVAGSFALWPRLAPGAHAEGTALLKPPGHDFRHGTWPNSTPLAQPARPIPGELCTSTHTAPGAREGESRAWLVQHPGVLCHVPRAPGSAPQVVGAPAPPAGAPWGAHAASLRVHGAHTTGGVHKYLSPASILL